MKFSFEGWDGLIFFDTSEHQLGEKRLFQLPPLGGQWKIIFDFKPTEYIQDGRKRIVMSLGLGHNDHRVTGYSLAIGSPKIFLRCRIMHPNASAAVHSVGKVESNELPVVGEWTRVEISREKEEDKYFLYLTVGGKELGKSDVTFAESRAAPPASTFLHLNVTKTQPGFVRRLVALRK